MSTVLNVCPEILHIELTHPHALLARVELFGRIKLGRRPATEAELESKITKEIRETFIMDELTKVIEAYERLHSDDVGACSQRPYRANLKKVR